jgi:hypothetical protein
VRADPTRSSSLLSGGRGPEGDDFARAFVLFRALSTALAIGGGRFTDTARAPAPRPHALPPGTAAHEPDDRNVGHVGEPRRDVDAAGYRDSARREGADLTAQGDQRVRQGESGLLTKYTPPTSEPRPVRPRHELDDTHPCLALVLPIHCIGYRPLSWELFRPLAAHSERESGPKITSPRSQRTKGGQHVTSRACRTQRRQPIFRGDHPIAPSHDQKGKHHMRSKLILAGLAAALVMAFATTSASARNISISHGELFLVVWSQLRFVSGGTTAAECDVTLDGSFHYKTFLKVRESLVGYITRAIANNCGSGSATVLTTNLPWHIRYQGFEGTLPNITGIRLRLLLTEFRLHDRIFGTECLARTTSTEPAEGVARLSAGTERRLVTGLTADGNARIRCGILNGTFEGTGVVRELPNLSTNLLVRLI